jgi:hypothetical protein
VTVPTYEHPAFGLHVYICPQCGHPGARGAICGGLHDPPEAVRMVPSTAVAMAYRTYQRAELDPDARSGASVEEWERGETEPSPAEVIGIAATLNQPVHFFFIDHDTQ